MSALVILSAVVLPLLLSEFSEVSPWAARHLLIWAANYLPGPERSERYREEWLAGLETVPGKLTKLVKALSIVCYTVPVMNWRVNNTQYLWPARKAAVAALSVLVPSLGLKLRKRLTGAYVLYAGVPWDGVFTVDDLDRFVSTARKVAMAGRIMARTTTFREARATGVVDHRRKRITIFLGEHSRSSGLPITKLSYHPPVGSTEGYAIIQCEFMPPGESGESFLPPSSS